MHYEAFIRLHKAGLSNYMPTSTTSSLKSHFIVYNFNISIKNILKILFADSCKGIEIPIFLQGLVFEGRKKCRDIFNGYIEVINYKV